MTDEIQKASVGARIGLGVMVVAFFLAALLGQPYLDNLGEWIASDPEQAFERVYLMILVVSVFSVPLLAVGLMYVYLGSRAVSTERFPPEGMSVIVDTPIKRGREARSSGRRTRIGGVLLVILAIGFPAALYVIVRRLAESL